MALQYNSSPLMRGKPTVDGMVLSFEDSKVMYVWTLLEVTSAKRIQFINQEVGMHINFCKSVEFV
jgi:hypothetical protein